MVMADIPLATIPLVIKVLETCLRGYDLFTEAKRIGQGSQTLLWKFKIQQTRLHMWGREWGILDDSQRQNRTARDPEDYRFILETLFRIEDLLTDYKKLKTRYGLSLVTEDPHYRSQRNDGPIEDVIAQEFTAYHQKDVEKRRDRSTANSFMRKFRWVTADKGKFESIISDLKDYNDGLYQLLATAERRSLRHGLSAELVTTNNITDLLDLENASATLESLSQVAGMRRYINTASTIVSQKSLEVPGTEIALCPSDHGTEALSRTLAHYTSKNGRKLVIVEWKSYDRDAHHSVKMSQLNRLNSLARLLHDAAKPKALRVPSCVGYFCDDWHPRIGFLFEYSCQNPVNDVPQSLYSLLEGSNVPFLGARFRLAYELSLSLSLLHSSGWLHKGIRSDNILFIRPTGREGDRPDLQNPQILGFEYSRQDTPFAETDLVVSAQEYHNIYRHPRSIGDSRDRFCRAFDIYSLGIVLVEIGFWRSISDIQGDDDALDTFRDHLHDFYIPQLGSKVGEIYMKAVQSCLTGQLADVEVDDERSQKGFYWEVVAALAKLVA